MPCYVKGFYCLWQVEEDFVFLPLAFWDLFPILSSSPLNLVWWGKVIIGLLNDEETEEAI